jgi:hypothetical protein
MKSFCFDDFMVGIKIQARGSLDFNKITINFHPSEKSERPHLLCCPGLAVCEYGFALDASDLQPPKLLQHQGSL